MWSLPHERDHQEVKVETTYVGARMKSDMCEGFCSVKDRKNNLKN